MKRNNKKNTPINIAIDLGNFNNKVLVNDKIFIFESRFREITDDISIKTGTIFTFNGKTYRHMDGVFEISCEKACRNNLLLNLFFSIASSLQRDCEVNIAIGLPISQYKQDKEKLIEFINQNNHQNVSLNKNTYNITIKSVDVIPEAIGAYYSSVDDFESLNATVVDIGGKTTDICTISYDGSVQSYTTIQIGSFDTFTKIANVINERYPSSCASVEDVQHILDKGLTVNGIKVDLPEIDFILREDASIISRNIKLNDKKSELNYILIVGGHGHILYNYLKETIPHIEIHSDYLFANVIGYYKVLTEGE